MRDVSSFLPTNFIKIRRDPVCTGCVDGLV